METGFITDAEARRLREEFGTPLYVYDAVGFERRAQEAMAFPNAFGLTVRYAMKALPNRAILKLFRAAGLHIDASSGYEVDRALRAGYLPPEISLSTQELPADFARFLEQGVKINACSLAQLTAIGKACPGARIGLRVNPGVGSGGTGKTNVGGPSSSFGTWHGHLDEAAEIAEHCGLIIERIHTHIGSGSDPAVWKHVAGISLACVRRFPEVHTLNLGGGYKVARIAGEKATDLQDCGAPVRQLFLDFEQETGRKLHLEIEPGTFLVANQGMILATIQDVVTTGADGYQFAKLDSGMTELLRPSLYAAQHPIKVIPADTTGLRENTPVVFVGHCCESGDLVSPTPDNAEALGPRDVAQPVLGDLCLIGGCGAYASAMSSKNYNSFPEAAEVLKGADGRFKLIRKRQTLEQMLVNEVD